ncbi:MAG TPA: DUF4157 domain-containing protein [Thermoanaerobaculia bacterium]|nr:DUF4157 domain-containing protein [Thermoanaerobaculia bacterium]
MNDLLRTPGRPLDKGTRGDMELRFGHDFSRVRIHTGADAERATAAVGAEAWTVGQHIAFRHPHISPRLLTHELTHTVQQSAAGDGEVVLGESGDALEAEASRLSGVEGPLLVSRQVSRPTLSRENAAQTQQVLATGTAPGSGLQFYPTALAGTRIGPVTPGESDTAPRLSVIVGQGMTIDMMAQSLLPLWTTAAPFQPTATSGPAPAPAQIDTQTLARALIVYNQFHLPVPAMTNWRAGFRFPLPVDIDPQTNEGIVHPTIIANLATMFDPAWEPLRSAAAPAIGQSNATDLATRVTEFLAANPDALSRGYALLGRSLTNAAAERDFVLAVLTQTGSSAFEVALELMNGAVNHQIALLASQTAGAAILARIRTLLNAPPANMAQQRQSDIARAIAMLDRVANVTARPTPAVQQAAPAGQTPAAISAEGTAFIAQFEGFFDHLYNDPAEGHHCTVGLGHLVHRGPCNGAASEAPFANGVTRDQALQLLAQETAQAATAVQNAVRVPLNQAQLDALISFTFNVGAGAFRDSGLLRAINENRFNDVPAEMNRWTRGGNRVLPGLVRRRAAEGNLFTTGAYQ